MQFNKNHCEKEWVEPLMQVWYESIPLTLIPIVREYSFYSCQEFKSKTQTTDAKAVPLCTKVHDLHRYDIIFSSLSNLTSVPFLHIVSTTAKLSLGKCTVRVRIASCSLLIIMTKKYQGGHTSIWYVHKCKKKAILFVK